MTLPLLEAQVYTRLNMSPSHFRQWLWQQW